MKALGFAMGAVATAGPVIHVEGSGPEASSTASRGSQQARSASHGPDSCGFYESMTTAAGRRNAIGAPGREDTRYRVFSYT